MKKQSVKRLRTRWKTGPETDSEQSLQKSNAACSIMRFLAVDFSH